MRGLLAFIGNAGLDDDDWLRICMAAKSAGGAFEDVFAWSANSKKHDDREFALKWKSWTDKPGGVGVGTLYKLGQVGGWNGDLSARGQATRAHVDVKRAEKLHGPVGLFLLPIADSGERKSTCDGFFAKPIRDYESAQAEASMPTRPPRR